MKFDPIDSDTLVVRCDPEVCLDIADELRESAAASAGMIETAANMIFDLSDTQYLDSTGLGIFFAKLFKKVQFRVGAGIQPDIWRLLWAMNTRIPIFHRTLPDLQSAIDYVRWKPEAENLEAKLKAIKDPDELFETGEIFRLRWRDAFLAREFYARSARNGGPAKSRDRARCLLFHGLNLARDGLDAGANRAFGIALEIGFDTDAVLELEALGLLLDLLREGGAVFFLDRSLSRKEYSHLRTVREHLQNGGEDSD